MLSITYKAVCIASNRRKDGTYPVKIRVTFKGASRRLPTTLVARSSDLTRSLHIKSPDILNKAQTLITEMRDTTAYLSPFTIENWDVDRVIRHIRAELAVQTFRLDFFEYAERILANANPSTRHAYDSALNSFSHFIGSRKLDINDITKSMLIAWRDKTAAGNKKHYRGGTWRETSKVQGGGQAIRHLIKIKHIYKVAQNEYNGDERLLIPRNPFNGISTATPPPTHGQRNLGAEIIQKIINAREEGFKQIALDTFLLSFCLMGANLADLFEAADVSGPVWVYNRKKTKNRRQDRAEMRVTIPPEAQPILQRLGARNRGEWLVSLHCFAKSTDLCTQRINYALRKWAEREGVEPFTFYAARKTWASLARRAGVEKATIDECLCHIGDFRVADIYIERDYALMDAANRRVLDGLQFPGMRDL